MNTAMKTQAQTCSKDTTDAETKIKELRELFADAPEVGKKALENVLRQLASQVAQTPPPPVESAGRVGIRLGKVSELTIIVPLAPGGAKRLRAFLKLLGGNLAGADDVGTFGHGSGRRADATWPPRRTALEQRRTRQGSVVVQRRRYP